jgi:hypothetical protein
VRVLIISFVFPPHNVIGAVRVGKMAKYLSRFGHAVRVVAAHDQPFPKTLPLEIPADNVTYTPWIRVDRPLRAAASVAAHLRGRHGTATPKTGNPAELPGPSRRAAVRASVVARYWNLFFIPDDNVGWLPTAMTAGLRIARDFRPHVIYASGRPWTSLVVAHWVSRRCGVPWIAELRDPWGSDPYDPSPRLRRRLDDWLSRHVVRSAAGVVTVSEPLAEAFRRKYKKPTCVVLNGYDDDDRPAKRVASDAHDDGRLWLVHTGSFYVQRDFAPLVHALHHLGERAGRVRVSFVGADPSGMGPGLALADALGVAGSFELSPMVSYTESLRLQRAADVLLLVMWNDPREHGTLTGKLFEYVGARRPILLVGLTTGAAADLVKSRSLGVALDDPDLIAEWLSDRLDEKERTGRTAAPTLLAQSDLTRESQARVLETFLERFARRDGDQPCCPDPQALTTNGR